MGKRRRYKKSRLPNFQPQAMPTESAPQMVSLGDAAGAVGKVLGRRKVAGLTIRYEVACCACAGTNERCFKCDGTGFYRRELVESASDVVDFPIGSSRSRTEIGFASDSRGGGYGVRELGRFASGPDHDDHDN